MAEKAPREGSQKPTLDGLIIEDLVYSLEVKLINTDKNWFTDEGKAYPSLEYHDPAETFDFQSVAKAIKKKIPHLNAEELEDLKNNFGSSVLREVKRFREKKEGYLARNYEKLKPYRQTEVTGEVRKISVMEKEVEEILELIEQCRSKNKQTENIREITSEKIKSTTDN